MRSLHPPPFDGVDDAETTIEDTTELLAGSTRETVLSVLFMTQTLPSPMAKNRAPAPARMVGTIAPEDGSTLLSVSVAALVTRPPSPARSAFADGGAPNVLVTVSLIGSIRRCGSRLPRTKTPSSPAATDDSSVIVVNGNAMVTSTVPIPIDPYQRRRGTVGGPQRVRTQHPSARQG